MKTKIAFNDIPNAIGRDEMKEVVGGFSSIIWGNTSTSSGHTDGILPVVFESGAANSSSSWHATANGMSTSNATDISRFFEYITGQSNGQNISNYNPNMSQINSFIGQEIQFTAGGMITLPNGTVWGGELNEVIIPSGGGSTAQTLGAVAFGWDTKTMLSQLAAGGDAAGDLAGYFKYLERVGLAGMAIGAGVTINDAINNGGISDYHVADLGTQALIYGVATALPVAGWALGAAYFLGNYYTEQRYGQGLYEHLSEAK